MTKRFRFPKGTRRLNIPFRLNDLEPWQEQVDRELDVCVKKFGTSKSSGYGYIIENGNAMIYIQKI